MLKNTGKKIEIANCGDKAISVGEKSRVKINESTIRFSSIGLAVKDSSMAEIYNSEIHDSSICFAAYRKKQEFSGGIIKIGKTNCDKDKFFKQKGSKITSGL